MFIYYSIVIFIFGLVLGSFYTVVGERLPNDESIVKPPSHCPKCGHILKFYELVPVLSFVFLKGKCLKCKNRIPILSTLIEILTGTLFLVAYIKFNISIEFFIAITFISMLVIVIVSDIKYMLICDEVLIIGCILIFVLKIFDVGIKNALLAVIYGIVSAIVIFIIKKIGDFIFKRESMGGGDIKLMFCFGLVMGIASSIASIFLASFIGLPISLIFIKNNTTHEIPFGPYLSVAALILYLTQFDVVNMLINM